MKHASAQALESIASVIDGIRSLGLLKERKPGIFYLGSKAFLHFHEDAAGLFADIKLDHSEFTRLAVNTKAEQDKLVKAAAKALATASRSKR